MRGGSTFLMLLTALALGAVVVAEVRYGAMDALALAFGAAEPAVVSPAAHDDRMPDAQPSVRALPPLSALRETRSRPLFYEYRKIPEAPTPPQPVVAPAPRVQSPVVPLAELKLSAIVIEDEEPVALVREGGSLETQHIKVNESLGGWTVKEIRAQSLLLEANGKQQELKLWTFQPGEVPARTGSKPARRRNTNTLTPLNRRQAARRRATAENQTTTNARSAVAAAAERARIRAKARARARAKASEETQASGSRAINKGTCGLSRC